MANYDMSVHGPDGPIPIDLAGIRRRNRSTSIVYNRPLLSVMIDEGDDAATWRYRQNRAVCLTCFVKIDEYIPESECYEKGHEVI